MLTITFLEQSPDRLTMNKILTENKPSTDRKVTVIGPPKKIGCMFVPPKPDKPDIPKAGPKQNC